MLKRSGYSLLILLILGYPVFSLLKPSAATADINSCQASMVAHAVSPHSGNSFTIHITNTDSNNINWVKVTRPSGNFTILSNNSAGWSDSTSADIANESNGNLAAGDGMDVTISVQSANVQADPADWLVETSDSGGQNPFTCGGNLSMAITGDISDITPPSIYNLSVNNLSTTSVEVSWLTDELSDSRVDYGFGGDYGNSTDVDPSMVTRHSVILIGLIPGAGYHYQVVSADAVGNTSYSSDSTFLTTSEEIVGSGTPHTSPAIGLAITNPGDKIPPKISLSTQLSHVVQSLPAIAGNASDDIAVARVEFSTDGGKNWLLVDSTTGLGTKTVSFSFTPSNLDDGNYDILARAIDGGGNIAATPAVTLVVDRLPPTVGGSVLSLGPQVVENNAVGEISTLAGIDEKISLSAVGGPTSITLSTTSTNSKLKNKTFSLTQSVDSGLWNGIISFGKPGTYRLIANSIDGAGNKATKVINTVSAAAPAKVLKANGQPASAKVTAYYLRPDSSSWVLWDADAYGQNNPQTTDADGSFRLFLPAGTYYLKARGKDFAPITSNIFKLKDPSPILTTLEASKGSGLLNSVRSSFLVRPIDLNFSAQANTGNLKGVLLGKQVPDFKLTDTDGQAVSPASLLGRPTIISFMTSWAPTTSDQLPALNQLASNKDINVEPIALQQNASEMRAYQSISGYSLNWLADPDSTTSASFNAPSLPTHYFIDRNGVIKKIVTGVLSGKELLNNLAGL